MSGCMSVCLPATYSLSKPVVCLCHRLSLSSFVFCLSSAFLSACLSLCLIFLLRVRVCLYNLSLYLLICLSVCLCVCLLPGPTLQRRRIGAFYSGGHRLLWHSSASLVCSRCHSRLGLLPCNCIANLNCIRCSAMTRADIHTHAHIHKHCPSRLILMDPHAALYAS